MDSVDEMRGTAKLYDFVLTAFGFDPNTTSDKTIDKVLTSDLADPASFANAQKDPKYKALAAAFNFDTEGNKTAPLLAQSQFMIQQVAKDYVILQTRYGNDGERTKATEGGAATIPSRCRTSPRSPNSSAIAGWSISC